MMILSFHICVDNCLSGWSQAKSSCGMDGWTTISYKSEIENNLMIYIAQSVLQQCNMLPVSAELDLVPTCRG